MPGGIPASALAANISAGATSLTLTTGDGANWPSVFPFDVIVNRGSATSRERLTVGGRTSDTLNSLIRGIDGTTAQSHSLGDTIEVAVAGSYLDELGQLLGGTAGDMYYYDGSALQKLAKGTSEQMLKQGASAPSWSWQALPKFATTGARTTAIPAPADGDASYLNAGDATEGPEFYNGSNWRKPWNMQWGRIGGVSLTGGDQSGISATADITSATLTFTAVTGRQYRAVANVLVQQVTTGATFNILLTDGSNAVQTQPGATLGIGSFYTQSLCFEFTASAGSVTRKLRATTGAGTLTVAKNASNPLVFYIEDVGPSGNPT